MSLSSSPPQQKQKQKQLEQQPQNKKAPAGGYWYYVVVLMIAGLITTLGTSWLSTLAFTRSTGDVGLTPTQSEKVEHPSSLDKRDTSTTCLGEVEEDTEQVFPSNTTWKPSGEVEIGLEHSLQRALMEKETQGAMPVRFMVLNDFDANHRVEILWRSGPVVVAVAPQKSRAKVESLMGETLLVRTFSMEKNITLAHAFTAVTVNATDGTVSPRLLVENEAELPTLKMPRVPYHIPLDSTAKAIKFRNLSNKRLHKYWVPDSPHQAPVYQGVVEANSESTTNSYLTHRFRLVETGPKKRTVFEFQVNAQQEIYAYVETDTADPARLKSHNEELVFAKQYREKHPDRPWLSYYPHKPVQTFMWPADYIGQEHHIHTEHGPGGQPMNFTLKVVSVFPRAFQVDYLVSDEEAEEIIKAAKSRMKRSSVQMKGENGEIIDTDTRTSRNAWLARDSSVLVDRIYRRVADLLNVPESILTHGYPTGQAENMQVVHYKPGQWYAAHHDWGVHDSPHTRLGTVLLYLNTPKEGGQTTFPKAQVGDPRGLSVKAQKSKAVLFYSQFPDGNVDDASLHQAEAPGEGSEKYLANIWFHDSYWGKFSN